MNKSLTRSIGFWLLLILSLASAAVGGWIVAGQVGTMTSTLLDGTATGIEVYVGQSLVVVGAALLGAGVIGILLAVALTAVQALVSASPVVPSALTEGASEPTGESAATETDEKSAPTVTNRELASDEEELGDRDETQNGSSGSTATATKISVK